jgi:hypothetical protein
VVAERTGLLPARQAVAEADSQRLAADLKPQLAAVASARSLSHVSLELWINQTPLLILFVERCALFHFP